MDSFDLFGQKIQQNASLREAFGENPFSILDSKTGSWQNRKRKWKNLGIQSEIGRTAKTFHIQGWAKDNGRDMPSDTSIFDPVLCELMYKWFCPVGGAILDPFAGGSVRGIVANYLGFRYTGIDIRQEQIDSNRTQAKTILSEDNQPEYIVGDSNRVLDDITSEFDLVFSCPPYGDLEVYSDIKGDVSNMKYDDFLIAYGNIIKKCCDKLKNGGYAIFVVGEFRDSEGFYRGFVPDTYNCFKQCGLKLYNEAILCTPLGTAMLRAQGNMKSKKLVKVHQNILIFKKP